jgi:hypothetical protein
MNPESLVSGLCPSSGILKNWKLIVSETGPISVFRRGEGYIYSVRSLRKS